jgi:hypothetical protein
VRAEHLLVLVGPRGWDDDQIVQLAGAHSDQVRILGQISDSDLACLYSLCSRRCSPGRP